MRDARHIYLGWGNTTRRAVAINGHDVVVLMRGQQHTVLEDERARLFLAAVSEVTNHMCGVLWSDKIAKMVAVVGRDNSDRIYDAVFDEFHLHA